MGRAGLMAQHKTKESKLSNQGYYYTLGDSVLRLTMRLYPLCPIMGKGAVKLNDA